jgi:hypothetical protein
MNEAEPQPAPGMAGTAVRYALEAVRFDWGEAYAIERDDEHGWRAKRLDGLGGWLTAAGADGLYEVIAADYALKPVPRSATLGESS